MYSWTGLSGLKELCIADIEICPSTSFELFLIKAKIASPIVTFVDSTCELESFLQLLKAKRNMAEMYNKKVFIIKILYG